MAVKIPWKFVIVVVLGVLLLVIFVIMREHVMEAIKPLGRGIINAINQIMAGRPPWL